MSLPHTHAKTLLQKFLPSPVSSIFSSLLNSVPSTCFHFSNLFKNKNESPTLIPITVPFLCSPFTAQLFKSHLHSFSLIPPLPFSHAHTNLALAPTTALKLSFSKSSFTSSGHLPVLILPDLLLDKAHLPSSVKPHLAYRLSHSGFPLTSLTLPLIILP